MIASVSLYDVSRPVGCRATCLLSVWFDRFICEKIHYYISTNKTQFQAPVLEIRMKVTDRDESHMKSVKKFQITKLCLDMTVFFSKSPHFSKSPIPELIQ